MVISDSEIENLYKLMTKIEERKKFLFIMYEDIKPDQVGIDVLDYETEDAVDGGWYNVQEAEELLLEYLEDV